jgi:SAM-dependent methyltransferase
MSAEGADRLRREREYHDARYETETRASAGKYYAVDASEGAYRDHLEAVAPGERVLEYGCGVGSAAFELAAAGAEVTGIDISPVAIAKARAEAERRGLEGVHFVEMDAEALEIAEASVDVVCGSGILHHLDLDRAASEIWRVLRPGGRAVFKEPLGSNPVINLYRRLTPKMRTRDEHPFLDADFERLRQRFETVDVEVFNLVALAGVPLRRVPGGSRILAGLHAIDRWLFMRVPPARRWAWIAVIRLQR